MSGLLDCVGHFVAASNSDAFFCEGHYPTHPPPTETTTQHTVQVFVQERNSICNGIGKFEVAAHIFFEEQRTSSLPV